MAGVPIEDQNIVLRTLGSRRTTHSPANFTVIGTQSNNAEHKAAVAKTVERLAAEKKNLRTQEPLFREQANIRRSRVPAAAAAAANANANAALNRVFGERNEHVESNRLYRIAPRIIPTPPDRILGPGRNYESAEVIGLFSMGAEEWEDPMKGFLELWDGLLETEKGKAKLAEKKKELANEIRAYRAKNVKYIIDYIKRDKDYMAYEKEKRNIKYGVPDAWQPVWLLMPASFSGEKVFLVKIKQSPGGLLNTYNETRGANYVDDGVPSSWEPTNEELELMAYSQNELDGMIEGKYTYNDMIADLIPRLLGIQVHDEELDWWVKYASSSDQECATNGFWDEERFKSYPRKISALISPYPNKIEYAGYEHAYDDVLDIKIFKAKLRSLVEHCKRKY
jgi:hypothetical protein